MNTTTAPRSLAVLVVAGFLLFAGLQVFFSLTWTSFFAWSNVAQAWWLNSLLSTVITLAATFLTTIGILAKKPVPLVSGGVAILGGLSLGMAGVLLIVGPGNLWPLVLLLGCALLGGAVVLGTGVAAVLRRMSRPSAA